MFQLVHGDFQRFRGTTWQAEGMRAYVKKLVHEVLCNGAEDDKTALIGNSTTAIDEVAERPSKITFYVHTKPGWGGNGAFTWWFSSTGDPSVIGADYDVNRLDRYTECVYVRERDSAYVVLPGLREPENRTQLSLATDFRAAVMNEQEEEDCAPGAWVRFP